MAMEREGPFRPYAPPANVNAVLQRLRRMNTPQRLGPEFLSGAGITEALHGRVLSALRFLEFITEDNRPTDTLRTLVVAPDEEYRKLLEQTVRSAYREDFENIDPAVDPQSRILSTFQRYQPRSQHERQVMLFLGLCREAGIPVLDAPRDRGMQDGGKKAARPKGRPPGRTKAPAPVVGTTPVAPPLPAGDRNDAPGSSALTRGLVGFIERDAELLDDNDFAEVWQALGTVVGKVARARARARREAEASRGQAAAEGGDEETEQD